MTESARESSLSPIAATPNSIVSPRSLRLARIIRAVALFAVGMVIAFTATLHENLATDRWMLTGGLALIGLATLYEHFVQRNDRSSWPIALRAAFMFFAAIAVLVSADEIGFAIAVAAWAVANAIVLFFPVLGSTTSQKQALRKQALPAVLLSLALAIVVVILRDDPVAVIGFFGVYALISGVFLGISAFDNRNAHGNAGRDFAETVPDSDDPRLDPSQTFTS